MSLLVVGSIALDTIETPFGKVTKALGGSAVFISLAAAYFIKPVRVVGVIGGDFAQAHLDFLSERGIDIDGIQMVKEGQTFHWSGKYDYDLNSRVTLKTELGVFQKFNPQVPPGYAKSAYVCLGNIDPDLQRNVLQKVQKPRLVVGDTMNYWIESKPDSLRQTLKVLDVLIVNDSEARLLTQEPNLIKAGKRIMEMGPKIVIIKKGEHGALLIHENTIFSAPAYPLETIYDPTGAGDSFAGGFIGWLAKSDDLSSENLKRAVIYGSTLASFCVEKFSVDGLKDLSYLEVKDRYRSFMKLSRFDDSE